jgi:hypothetical protein
VLITSTEVSAATRLYFNVTENTLNISNSILQETKNEKGVIYIVDD